MGQLRLVDYLDRLTVIGKPDGPMRNTIHQHSEEPFLCA
jgi:hypothetical protein